MYFIYLAIVAKKISCCRDDRNIVNERIIITAIQRYLKKKQIKKQNYDMLSFYCREKNKERH